MNFSEYQKACERTVKPDATEVDRFTEFCFGLAGETGEAIDVVKKHLFHGHKLDKEKLAKELGDVMWYLSSTATTAGLSLDDIAAGNIEKLRKRYPDGFTPEKSMNRTGE